MVDNYMVDIYIADEEQWGWYIDIEDINYNNICMTNKPYENKNKNDDCYLNDHYSNLENMIFDYDTDENLSILSRYLLRISSVTFLSISVSLSMTYLLIYML